MKSDDLKETKEQVSVKMTYVLIDYTNHRGERRERVVAPEGIRYGKSEFHEEAQWLLDAWDVEKHEKRSFAMKDIHSWRPAVIREDVESSEPSLTKEERNYLVHWLRARIMERESGVHPGGCKKVVRHLRKLEEVLSCDDGEVEQLRTRLEVAESSLERVRLNYDEMKESFLELAAKLV